MTFMPIFDKLQFCPYVLYNFRVSQFPCFAFQLRKIQFMPTKYPKHIENDYGIFRGVTSPVSCNLQNKKETTVVFRRPSDDKVSLFLEDLEF